MDKKVQLYWRITSGGSEFGFPVTRATSHILIDGEMVEYPRATAMVFPGGATQLTISQREGESKVLVGLDQGFVQLTATLWLLYMAQAGDDDEVFTGLMPTEEVTTEKRMATLFDDIHGFLQDEMKKGHTDETE